jgi:F-type H+-transporting ATPase subunit epsilon
MKLKLKIIDLDGVYFSNDVDLVNVVTSSGNLTILANHLPLISNIKISHLYIKEDGVITKFAIAGGTLFVSETECKIITTAIEKDSEIDFTRAIKAKERAEERIAMNSDDIDLKRAEVSLKKALNRLSLR